MVVIITPLVLLASYTFAYGILIIREEKTTMELEKPIETINITTDSKPKVMCDGCAQYKDNLKQVKLQDIQQPVLLCEECQLKFKEVDND